MNDPSQPRIFVIDDPLAVERLSNLLAGWEPSLTFKRPPSDAVLYEPDGTLYAVALSDCTLEIPRRTEAIKSGALAVIPRAFPADAGPSADFVGICHDGPPPDHFRERFIQVRGFDVPSAEHFAKEPDGLQWRIPRTEVRYRLSYATLDVTAANGNVSLGACPFLRLVLSIEGAAFFRESTFDATRPVLLPARSVFLNYPGELLSVEGTVRLGILEIPTDLEHEERRRLQFRRDEENPSPEFRTNPT